MFAISPEPEHRRQLRDSVADFTARAVSSRALRDDLQSAAGFSMARWGEMAALGWTSMVLPEAFDGLGMEFGDLAALHAEIGRAALPEPLAVVPLLVSRLLALGDNRGLAERLLPALVAGATIATLAWQGAPGALGAGEVGPKAARAAGGWALSGEALFVSHAPAASALVVAAAADDGVVLLWLDRMPPLVEVIRHADGTPQARVAFDGIALGAEAVIAGPRQGAALLEAGLDTARLAAAAELLGLMERTYEMTLDHLRQRNQFGKPIGAFQALQHRAADLYIQIELARSALDRAVRAMDFGADAATRAAQVSAAKSRCGDAALKLVREAIQMHGAIGYTREYDLSLYVNRILYLSAWLGNAQSHRQRWSALRLTSEGTR